MKTYTHPNIVMPCGNVVVKFYDFADSGNETLPKCIKEIGDVEEGFEINFGDYYSPECDFVLHNNSTNTIYDMLINNDLFVSVVIDNSDLYFYGFVDKNSIDTNNLKTEISFEGVGAFSYLGKMPISNFKINSTYDKTQIHNFLKKMVTPIGLSATIEYMVRRFFKGTNIYYEGNFNDLFIDDTVWGNEDYPNSYDAQCMNGLELLNVLKNDFFFYPSVIYDGTDFKLKIIEKDYYDTDNLTTLPIVKNEEEDLDFLGRSVTVDLKNRPDGMSSADTRYSVVDNSLYGVEDIIQEHIHTDYTGAAVDGFAPHNRLYIRDRNANVFGDIVQIINYNKNGHTHLFSFHEAMFEAIKTNHFNYKKGVVLVLHGLTSSINGTSKIEYLSPGYRFVKGGLDHYIHSVKRSLMKNESEAKCLVLG